MSKNLILSILVVATICILVFFNVRLIGNYRDVLRSKEDLDVIISDQSFLFQSLEHVVELKGAIVLPDEIEWYKEDELKLHGLQDTTFRYLLWLPDSGCQPCWESMMSDTIAEALNYLKTLVILSNNPNHKDVVFLRRKYNITCKIVNVESENQTIQILKDKPPMLLMLTNENEVKNGIIVDINKPTSLVKWIESNHLY